MYTRRGLVTTCLPLALALPLGLTLGGRRARAATGATKRIIVVFAQGGWDVTRVFAPQFGDGSVAMEADAEEATVGGLRFVDHPDRPSVRGFFERHHARSAILNGLLVPSVAHDACTRLVMTGMSDDTAPDWAARVAYDGSADFALPGFVAAGPSFPADAGSAVVRNGEGGQLDRLLRDGVAATLDQPVEPLSLSAQDRIDAFVSARSAAALSRSTGLARTTRDAFDRSLRHARDVKALSGLDFSADELLSSQVALGLTLLGEGVSRAVTVRSAADFAWDTHTNNDAGQSPLWEDLFADLLLLADGLEALPGTVEASLLDETVVVVLSEMARTPGLNKDDGKDHWPYTSALLFGGGVAGDRVLGGFDAQFFGDRVDPATGEIWGDGEELTTTMLGATLLALTGVEADGNEATVSPLASLLG